MVKATPENITAIIPARSGSKTIKNKNIINLGNYPLIAYSIAVAKSSKLINKVIVSTDSPKIRDIALRFGAEVPFLRPAEISRDSSVDIDFFKHYISFAEENNYSKPEYLVHLRPTTPLRDVNVIDRGIEFLLSKPEASGLRSVYEHNFSPYKVFKLENSFLKGFFPDESRTEYYNLPRQTFPQTYIPNGYVDIVLSSTIKCNTLHGDKFLGYVVDKVPDIDDLEDLAYAKSCLNEDRFRSLLEYIKEEYG